MLGQTIFEVGTVDIHTLFLRTGYQSPLVWEIYIYIHIVCILETRLGVAVLSCTTSWYTGCEMNRSGGNKTEAKVVSIL